LIDIYKKADEWKNLGATIYNTVVGDLQAGPGDRAAWDFCWDYVSARDAADGFSSFDFLDHVRSNISRLPNDARKQIIEWLDFCDDVISAKHDFPTSWQDSKNP